jgi:hypothetical protein
MYPLTADVSGVLAAARDRQAADISRGFGWLFRMVRQMWRRPAADSPLDSVGAIR